ncbi:MAG: rRNA (cytosine967-C5)-methyltransferase, partial [Chthoniobacter sp.]|nr:rRNA (cytosine967-C5)-methyltransferase [Chthoniobacter sp.]
MSRANPRAACLEVLARWEQSFQFADEILHATFDATRFAPLDRALLTELFYGIIRHRQSLDFVIAQLREGEIDIATRHVLQLGLYQILHMRVPRHAAVNETVQLAGRARGLVNAILRRSIREENALRRRLAAAPMDVRFSHPQFLVERWRANFGEAATERLCAWNNEPAQVFARANELKVTRGELLRTADAEPLETHPLMLRVKQIPMDWIMHGLCYMQDPSTLAACELLDPQAGERVL